MPLYEYECQACHRRIEKIQKFSDAELTVCPHCGGVLERTVTAPAFQFAGGGWYKDLYSSAKPSESTGSSDSGGDKSGGDKSGGKGDSGSGATASGDSSPSAATSAASAPTSAPAAAPSAAPAASKT